MSDNDTALLNALDVQIRTHVREQLIQLLSTPSFLFRLEELAGRIGTVEDQISQLEAGAGVTKSYSQVLGDQLNNLEQKMKTADVLASTAVTPAVLDDYVRRDFKFYARVQQLIDKHTEDESHLAVDDVLESDVFSDTLIATVDERLKDTEWVSMFLATEIARQVRFALEGANFTVACAD